jgi:membrane protein implicated in regulation of membrane protease activity
MFFIWFGLGAGLIVVAIPGPGWQWEAALFVGLAVVCVFFGRSFIHRDPKESADPALNRFWAVNSTGGR